MIITNISTFTSDDKSIDWYEENGVLYLNLDQCARGLGFVQNKNGVEYVRWETVNGYLSDFGFPNKLGKGDFIPENIFYRLAMKAKNEVAERFQAWIADDVIPSIRKTGIYGARRDSYLIEDAIERARRWIEEETERRQLALTVQAQAAELSVAIPKVSYYDHVLQSTDLVKVTDIAKDYGMSARAMNKKLAELGIQYRQGDTWYLYQKYADQGYTHSKTYTYEHKGGMPGSKIQTYWTQAGRKFIYDELKKDGILPMMEKVSVN